MSNPIVTVNVFQQVGPTPNNLQGTGALISQGATFNSAGVASLLTQLSDLTPLLVGSKAVTSATQSSGVATITTTAAHGLPLNDEIYITLAGFTPSNYNGTYLCKITGTSTFTYAVSGSPSSASVEGVYTLEDVGELLSMATTFFAQGSSTSVYVLELGAGSPSEGATFLTSWLTANPGIYYAFLVPRTWDANPVFLSLIASYESTTSKLYFFVTTTLATYSAYTALMKDVNALIEAPSYGAWPSNPLTEISFTGTWGSNVLTALTWASTGGGEATATTTTAHGVVPGNQFTITGCTPAGYNGTFIALPGTTGSTLIYALPTNPGTETVLGSLAASTQGFVTVTTTTAHGVQVGQYFTLAGTTPTAYNGIFQAIAGTTGSTLVYALAANPGSETILGTLLASYYSSAGIPSTEFSQAAPFWTWLQTYPPSATNKVAPFSRRFVSGVTPFPTPGNSALLTTLKTANISIIGTGAEGGISNTIMIWGNTLDGRPMNYWYSVDWVQINLNLNLSNAIINGSNNPVNPLYQNQAGITALEGVAAQTMGSAITFGLALGSVLQVQLDGPVFDANLNAGLYAGRAVVNAVPFTNYYEENPGDYAIGQYNGLSVSYAPLRGFDHITVNLVVTDFVG